MLERPKQQEGFLYFIECLCVGAFCLCLCSIAAGSLGPKILGEIGDFGAAIGSLNQSYTLTGIAVGHPNEVPGMPLGGVEKCMAPGDSASHAGSDFTDTGDFCDQDSSCGVRTCTAPAVQETL